MSGSESLASVYIYLRSHVIPMYSKVWGTTMAKGGKLLVFSFLQGNICGAACVGASNVLCSPLLLCTALPLVSIPDMFIDVGAKTNQTLYTRTPGLPKDCPLALTELTRVQNSSWQVLT